MESDQQGFEIFVTQDWRKEYEASLSIKQNPAEALRTAGMISRLTVSMIV
jgi:hypothetical protein